MFLLLRVAGASNMVNMGRVVTISLKGEDAQLGVVRAVDVANLLSGVDAALAQAAGSVINKPPAKTGRWPRAIADSSRLILRELRTGSVTAELALPDIEEDDGGRLDVNDDSLSDLAFRRLVANIDGSRSDPDVARSLQKLADVVGIGTRFDRLEFEGEGKTTDLDIVAVERLRGATVKPERRPDRVSGTLVEADFEKGTARLRTALDDSVMVTFDGALADDIQAALRQPADFTGVVEYDPSTNLAATVTLVAVERPEQLDVLSGAFWSDKTVAELAEEQGVTRLGSASELAMPDLTDDETDAFFAALER
jgi:hypothetical protein